ncbi:MAG TPA: hypothetical protein VLG50_03185 [Candidatus Saccharimonadales bacterium]|nr:hypothetical protein [Candidatus Saccharimonadales bacterium]
MFIKRLFLTSIVCGTFSQAIFAGPDRHEKWIAQVENKGLSRLQVEESKVKAPENKKKLNTSLIVASAVSGIAGCALMYWAYVKAQKLSK